VANIALRQTKLADLVQIKPHDLEEWDDETIKDTINEKYANKVC
jgi:hypothetical protein